MSTVQDIIDGGFSKSAAARPETMTSPAELVTEVGLCLLQIFQAIGREVPTMLGKTAQIAYASPGWSRPVDCLRALELLADGGTIADPALDPGDTIHLVAFNDRLFCEGLPSVYEFGQAFVPVGQAMDPTGGTLTLLYARAPIIPTQTTDSIDPLFPSFFDDILKCDIASYLAVKDQRDEDAAAFAGLKNAGVSQLIDWVRGQSYNLEQRFPLTAPPLANTDGGRQQPLKQ